MKTRALFVFTAVMSGLGLVVSSPSPGVAESPFGAVDARATADAMRVGVAVRKFLIVENFIDAGGPTAQAHLTGVGSDAFAALPDPGGLVIGYNTFVGLATGQGLPFEYPFYAAAKFPGAPKAETADPSGAYKVAANTTADSAEAVAQMRPTGGDAFVSGAMARSSVKLDGDAVVASSETFADAVALANGAVKLSGVASRSVTTRRAGQSDPTTETSLTVDLISVGDQQIRYGANGFEFLGTPVPAPSDTVADSLSEALKPLGLAIEIGKPAAVAGGMQAAVLDIRQAAPLPAGQSDIVLRFGGATSSVSAQENAPTLPAPALPGSSPGVDTSGDGSLSGSDEAAGSSAGVGGTDAPGGTDGTAGSFSSGSASARFGNSGATGPTFGSSALGGSPLGGAGLDGSALGVAGSTPGGASAPSAVTPGAGTPEARMAESAAPAQLASHRRSVVGPYAALVAAGLAMVLLAGAWARRSAAAALWTGR